MDLKRILNLNLIFWICLFGWIHQAAAEIRAGIRVELELSKGKSLYPCTDNIGVLIRVRNGPSDCFVNKSLLEKRFVLNMLIIDPAGRSLIPKWTEPKKEYPDAPPVLFLLNSQSKPSPASECVKFGENEVLTEKTCELGDYYNLELPGRYVAQVHLSVMEFRGQIGKEGGYCGLEDFKWSGVLKSNAQEFFIQNRTPIRIIPGVWSIDWSENQSITIQIPISNEKRFDSKIGLKNNNTTNWIDAKEVTFTSPLYMAPGRPYIRMLEAKTTFKTCKESLIKPPEPDQCQKIIEVAPEPGRSYRLIVLVKEKDGADLCGSQRITFK